MVSYAFKCIEIYAMKIYPFGFILMYNFTVRSGILYY